MRTRKKIDETFDPFPLVDVRHSAGYWRCRWVRLKVEPSVALKCGHCGRGSVIPKIDDKCRVCGAIVYRIFHRDARSADGGGK